MWIEIAVVVAALTVIVGVVSRAVSTRRGTDPRSGAAHREQRGGAWTAAAPIETAFPVERTPRERDIGDAAFVDGLVIGHYLAPFRPAEDRDPVQPEPADLAPDGGDGPSTTTWEPGEAVASDEIADQTAADLDLDVDAGYGHGGYVSTWEASEEDSDDDISDDGFGDGFGFEDGLDDDW